MQNKHNSQKKELLTSGESKPVVNVRDDVSPQTQHNSTSGMATGRKSCGGRHVK